ncbi:MAG TPA: ABC transporter ATP-binding protein [Gaiellaceae bacterium]|nr:ABC transporter ATP-binding protein [Gaiellaceae bacterium]
MIEVQELRKVYPGGVEAVKGIDFEVAPGEIFGLLGPNGAGKSTTIGMLTTTIRPSGGTARVGGFDVAESPLAARRVSSVVFQEAVVDRTLSGRANLELHARLWRVAPRVARERIAELSGALGIAELLDRPVGGYSGGERRRLEIARSLVSEPRVIFLDEPTVGLDPRIRHELLEVIGRLSSGSDLTILLTTHYLDEAERLCDRVAVMHEGRIVALDRPQRLRHALGRELVELRVRDDLPATLAVLRAHGIAAEDAFAVGSTLTLPLRDVSAGEAIATINDLGVASAISAREPTLDDVYLRLTGDRLAPAA